MEIDQKQKESKAEGSRLAHLYDGAKDYGAVDKQVHDALLADAIMDHHSKLDMKTVLREMEAESGRRADRESIVKSKNSSVMTRNWTLPALGIEIEGQVIFDQAEAYRAINKDDARIESEKNAKKEASFAGQPNWNPFDGSFGINTALGFKPERK